MPLALISGPLISELIINFVWVNILYLIIKNKNYKYINNIYFKIFLIFWIYILVRSIFTTENSEEIIKKFAYIRLGLFSISIWFLIDNNKNFLNHFYKFLSFSVAILLFDGYYQYFFSTNIIGFEIVDNRISSFFGDE
ncbi:MAG: O-antigen polymerase, partial [Euryarchaeota archaeon]|nr:O-antigen polymerase [Euryarchaeota archaeon]